MLGRPFGVILLAATLFVAGLAGIAAFWATLPRTSDTSPLMALFALVWSVIYLMAAILTWRRSRLAGPAVLGGLGLLLFPARYLFPGGRLFLPLVVVILLVAFVGYRYLWKGRELAG